MARPVKTSTSVKISAIISSYLKDKSVVSYEACIGDTLKDLKYVNEDGEVVTISGRLADIKYSGWKKADGKGGNVSCKGSFKSESVIKSIILDSSKIYNSVVNEIPTREILAYGADESDVVKIDISGKMTVDIKVTLSDGSESSATLTEGQKIFFLKTLSKGGVISGDYTIDAFIYVTNRKGEVDVKGIRLISDDYDVINLPFEAIVSCGQEGIEAVDEDSFSTAISAEGDKGIVIGSGEFTTPITVGGYSTVVEGKKYIDEPANIGRRKTNNIAKDETVLKGKITLEESSNVVIQGVTITDEAFIDATAANSVKFKNCKFVAATPENAKSYLIKAACKEDESTKFEFDGCYFGSNPNKGNNKLYNLFEINGRIADGSSFSNNYFAKDCCTHNMLNFYEVEDGATITVDNNVFEYSGNAMRIGFKGNAKATININNNEYKETDTSLDGIYAGYFLIQPYGKKTESFENVVININNMKKPEGQIGYVYCGSEDTQLTDKQLPTVKVDGNKIALPVLH